MKNIWKNKYLIIMFFVFLLWIKQENIVNASTNEVINNVQIENDNHQTDNKIIWFVSMYDIIEYPVFKNILNEKIVNQIIFDEIEKIYNSYEFTPESVVEFTVEYADENYLSILFSGYIFNEGFAYAATILWPVMIDIKNGKKLALNDIVNINKTFMEWFIQQLENYFNDLGNDIYKRYSKEEIHEKVLKADTDTIDEYPCVTSYFTKEKLCINFPIPRYLGEFIEVEILFAELNKKINIE